MGEIKFPRKINFDKVIINLNFTKKASSAVNNRTTAQGEHCHVQLPVYFDSALYIDTQRFGQCSVFLIPINKRQPLEISVVHLRWGRCTVVNSARPYREKIVESRKKYKLPWPGSVDTLL
jgi:hypothetical protein